MAKIILTCAEVAGKLRIRFHSFVNDKGETFLNVYDNTYNCQFPRTIRCAGWFYEIDATDMILVVNPGKKPFYTVKQSNIKVLSDRSMSSYMGTNLSMNTSTNTITDTSTDTSTKNTSKKGDTVQREFAKIFTVTECVVCMEKFQTKPLHLVVTHVHAMSVILL